MTSRNTHADTKNDGGTEAHKMPNINTITAEEFHKLHISGLTGIRADDIVQYRDAHGPFKDFDEINKVPMIGATMVEQIKTHFVCE